MTTQKLKPGDVEISHTRTASLRICVILCLVGIAATRKKSTSSSIKTARADTDPTVEANTPQGKLFNAPNFTDPEWWQKNSRITNSNCQY